MPQYDHLAWSRVEVERSRYRPSGFPQNEVPLRNARQHGEDLKEDSQRSLKAARNQRKRLGIDPSRLLVLELTFIEADLRSRLEEKFRVRIVEERKEEKEYENALYEVLLTFNDEQERTRFRSRDDLGERRITGFRPVRQSNGEAAPDQVYLQFSDRDEGKAFLAWLKAEDEVRASARAKDPKKMAREGTYRMLVQFPDTASLDSFEQELGLYQESAAYQKEASDTALTYKQRQELFDALDDVTLVTEEDRRGARLHSEGVPEEDAFYFDVDLWHPGAERMQEVEDQFQEIVEEAGGRVTDRREVAGSLFIARVRGSSDTLETLLRYDQAARVDLPPVFEEPDFEETGFNLFDPVNVPETLADPRRDLPLACIVDSGITEGHPLLRGMVVYGENFDSGESDEYDNIGHGTHVAGIAVYGDVRKCAENNDWDPQVRLLNAKIMRKAPGRDRAAFAEEKRVENQIEEAVKWGVQDHGCHVFNLSFGNSASPYQGGRQHPWALVLDELARTYDVVLVVAAGNTVPEVPAVSTSDRFQEEVLENTLSEKHNVIDPGCAVSALTVGAIARTDVPDRTSMRRSGDVRPMIAVPEGCPSPFTRTGLGLTRGRGLQRALKPELVAYGGNYLLGRPHGNDWKLNDPNLAEPSLNHDYVEGRLLRARCGTSFAAPYVTNICAQVEKKLTDETSGYRPSANLIRALTVHSANATDATLDWVERDGKTPSQAEQVRLQSVGFGMPDRERALYSTDARVVLYAEDEIPDDGVHVYHLKLPNTFQATRGKRRIRITLAYDPPSRDTRKEYIGRRLEFCLFRGADSSEAFGKLSDGNSANTANSRPTRTKLQWSTVQSALFERQQNRSFDDASWQVGVTSKSIFDTNTDEAQRYALVLSLEHESQVSMYQDVRQRLVQQVRVRQ